MERVSQTHIAELLVPYDPIPLTEKVARRRRAVISRIISLVITVVILVAIYFWQRDQVQGVRSSWCTRSSSRSRSSGWSWC